MGIESPVHLLFLAAVALIVLGPKRLPALAKALGQGIREFRESLTDGALGEHPVERPPALAPGQVVQVGQAPHPGHATPPNAAAPVVQPEQPSAALVASDTGVAPLADDPPAAPAASDSPPAT